MQPSNITVKGKTIDNHTRCVHYHSPLDIIAIKMKCCDTYYPCIDCHNESETHAAAVWPQEAFETKAVLCGNCFSELTIHAYLQSNDRCPVCQAAFNPGCQKHHHLYFEKNT